MPVALRIGVQTALGNKHTQRANKIPATPRTEPKKNASGRKNTPEIIEEYSWSLTLPTPLTK